MSDVDDLEEEPQVQQQEDRYGGDLLAFRQRNIERLKMMQDAMLRGGSSSSSSSASTASGSSAPFLSAEALGMAKKPKNASTPRGEGKRKFVADGEVERRSSARVAGTPARFTYNEADMLIHGISEVEINGVKHRKRDREREPGERRPHTNFRRASNLELGSGGEVYTKAHFEALGTCVVPWPHVNFEKTYDKDRGTTCHQCRQKTIDIKVKCTECVGLGSSFCGTCLQNRYGENLDEVLAKDSWSCPKCRDICNCSFCREKKGYPPTGILIWEAKRDGFPSVAHYLVTELQEDKVVARRQKAAEERAAKKAAASGEVAESDRASALEKDDAEADTSDETAENVSSPMMSDASPPLGDGPESDGPESDLSVATEEPEPPLKRQRTSSLRKTTVVSLSPTPTRSSKRNVAVTPVQQQAAAFPNGSPASASLSKPAVAGPSKRTDPEVGSVFAIYPDPDQSDGEVVWLGQVMQCASGKGKNRCVGVRWFERVRDSSTFGLTSSGLDMIPMDSLLDFTIESSPNPKSISVPKRYIGAITVTNFEALIRFAIEE